MAPLKLTYASCKYDRIEALRSGEVQVEGVDLNVIAFPSGRQIFDRMIGGQEFDTSELSASEFIAHAGRGNSPFVAIPVFPSRVFRHGYIFVNRRSGIRTRLSAGTPCWRRMSSTGPAGRRCCRSRT